MNRPLRPLVLALLAFLLGLLPALRLAPSPLPFLLLSVATLAAAVLLPSLHHARVAALPVLAAFALAGGALGAHAAAEAASDCRAAIPDGARVRVSGLLGSGTFPADFSDRPPLLPLVAPRRAPSGAPCGGELRVRLPPRPFDAAAGARVEVVGEWVRWSAPVAPSGWPRPPELAGHLQVDSVLSVHPPDAAAHPFLFLRGRVQRLLWDLFPRHFALAEALLLGRRERMDRSLQQAFARTGLVHLLAISGMHVGLFATVLLLIGGAARLSRTRIAWGAMAGVALYLVVIGAPASAVRSGIMVALALLAALLQRPAAALPLMSMAALLILSVHPLAALEPGTQLSFAGVGGLVFAQHVFPGGSPVRRKHRAARWLADALLASTAAFVATAPITAYHFGTLAPASLLANLPAVPLASLALVGVFAATALAPLAAPVGRLVADGTGASFDAMEQVARLAARLPFAQVEVARPGAWLSAGVLVALAVGLRAGGRLRAPIRVAVAAGTALAVVLAWPTLARARMVPLELYFLDVGQGDAVAIRTPADRWILIDAGPRGREFDAGERRVLPFLRAQGVRRLEVLILTHPDADHIGGAPAVLRGIRVGRVVEPGLPVGKAVYMELLSLVEAQEIPWSAARRGRTLQLDGVKLEFLWPEPAALDASVEANQISAIVRLRYGGFTALLPGDAGVEVEEKLVRWEGDSLRAQVLKAGHHGSVTSTGESLLRAARPELVVVSAGRRNRYGHPAPEVVRRLARHGIPLARTDREGTVVVRVERGGSAWRRVEP